MDKLELYFSQNPKDILKFYNSFDTPKSLFDFLFKMEKAKVKINIVQGDKNIVVVPTADAKGENAVNIKQKYYGSTIILVESSGEYYNFSHAMNVGIEKALTLNPEWIILTNDDVYPINYKILKDKLNNMTADIIVPKLIKYNGKNRETRICIYKINKLLNLIYKMKFINRMFPLHFRGRYIANSISIYKETYKYINVRANSFINYLLPVKNRLMCLPIIQPISIIKPEILKLYKFDETFVNGGEDLDLSIKFKIAGLKFCESNMEFEGKSGSSLGINEIRIYRNTLIEILLISYKLSKIYKS